MKAAVLVLSLISLTAGIVLSLIAQLMRRETAPPYIQCLFNPKFWRPVTQMKDWYTPLGYRLNIWGVVLIVLGAMLGLVQSQVL